MAFLFSIFTKSYEIGCFSFHFFSSSSCVCVWVCRVKKKTLIWESRNGKTISEGGRLARHVFLFEFIFQVPIPILFKSGICERLSRGWHRVRVHTTELRFLFLSFSFFISIYAIYIDIYRYMNMNMNCTRYSLLYPTEYS